MNMPAPTLKPEQVLVKMNYAPINPSDLNFINGLYGYKKELPVVPGWEGSGIIKKINSEKYTEEDLIGKKVSCFAPYEGNGTFAEFTAVDIDKCLVLDDDMDLI